MHTCCVIGLVVCAYLRRTAGHWKRQSCGHSHWRFAHHIAEPVGWGVLLMPGTECRGTGWGPCSTGGGRIQGKLFRYVRVIQCERKVSAMCIHLSYTGNSIKSYCTICSRYTYVRTYVYTYIRMYVYLAYKWAHQFCDVVEAPYYDVGTCTVANCNNLLDNGDFLAMQVILTYKPFCNC